MMNGVEGIGNVYATPAGFGTLPPLSGTETVFPLYCSTIAETVAAKSSADSGLTYAIPVSRKRPRDHPTINDHRGPPFTFLGEDFSFYFQQQQLEIDCFIAQYTEKVRLEMEERRKRYSRRIAAVVEEKIIKKLKSKDEEIEKMGKLNCALEERVQSLCVENQIWRDLAQANEATVNALRCNLEQVLAQVQEEQRQEQVADDAQSWCGSNSDQTENSNIGDGTNRICRSCGKEESCVLVLPCRHLCLCTFCASSLDTCPLCNSHKTATLHVNFSASP